MVGWHHWLDGHEFEQAELMMEREAWHAAVHGVTKSWTSELNWVVATIGNGEFSFQSQRKAMPRNIKTTVQLCSFCFQSLSYVWLSATTWTAACQASLSFTVSWSLLKLMSIELMMPSNHHPLSPTSSHASKVMLKILQVTLQQYVNWQLLDVQAEFRKGKGTRDQIANIRWIMEQAREFQKNIYFCFIDYTKGFDCVYHDKLQKIL